MSPFFSMDFPGTGTVSAREWMQDFAICLQGSLDQRKDLVFRTLDEADHGIFGAGLRIPSGDVKWLLTMAIYSEFSH